MDKDRLLKELVNRLLDTYERDLRSVVLYGSAAGDDFDPEHSDLNVLCVLREVSPEALEQAEQTANWWRAKGNPAPLLFETGEMERAADAFPIEFLDIREKHRVLHGEDPTPGIRIDPVLHRAQVEHEIRARLMGLRQHYLGVHRDKKAVLKLMVDALPSFATLFRHALVLAGAAGGALPASKRAVLEAAGRRFGFDAAPFLAILDLREERRRRFGVNVRATFAAYYAGINRVCAQVDALVQDTHKAEQT